MDDFGGCFSAIFEEVVQRFLQQVVQTEQVLLRSQQIGSKCFGNWSYVVIQQ